MVLYKLFRHLPPLYTFQNYRCSTCTLVHTKDIFNKSELKKPVVVKGWVKNLRKMKDMIFIDLNDGSFHKPLQIVIPKNISPEKLSFGCSVEAKGVLEVNKNNQTELIAEGLKIIGHCSSESYPFSPRKTYTDDYLRQFLHLRSRTSKFGALLRIRHQCRLAVHDFFTKEGFFHIDTPVLTSNDCEGAGEVFKVVPENVGLVTAKDNPDAAYFDVKTYLTVSGQLHLEAMARSLSQVYNFNPAFRAENSKSRLHLSEFYMVEAESVYVNNTSDLTQMVERLIKNITKSLMDRSAEDLHVYHKFDKELQQLSFANIKNILDKRFTVMSYSEACDILDRHSGELRTQVKDSAFSKEQELFLVNFNNGVPVFVVDWPKEIKPFYMKSSEEDPSNAMCFDLLCPVVGEVCGGSLREDDYEILNRNLLKHNLEKQLGWYLELRRFGNILTGGYGLGFERLIQVLLCVNNIKDTLPFPRWPHNCEL